LSPKHAQTKRKIGLNAAAFEEIITLLYEMRACRRCEPELPLGALPIFQLDPQAKILIAGQAPGRAAHLKGRPFDDPSGDRLRQWLGVSRDTFYDPANFAILPLGLC
jgi:uracil-DNA glycosylase